MSENPFEYVPVGLMKRLMAIIYDSLLLIALLFTVGIIFAAIFTFAINNGNAITPDHPAYPMYRSLILGILLLTAYLFFGWFWVHGGQTLGMKTWRIQLRTTGNGNISWSTAGIRFIVAIISWCSFGIGFLWAVGDSRKRTWHDLLSSTVLVQLEKK
jgi:uncharacterized RDD family membrane protein YckC